MTKTYKEGGLNMVDIYSYIHCLKIKWLKRYVRNSDGKCFKFLKSLLNIGKIFDTGKLVCELIINKIKNRF
jgi:hypothetical protein